MNFDVIILGSGPAGAAAAITCHGAGLKVAMVTRNIIDDVPSRTPVQSIHPGVVSLLDDLGLKGTLSNSSLMTFDSILVNGKENPLNPNEDTPWLGHHLDRKTWHQELLRYLESLPIDLHTNTKIRKVTRGPESIIKVTTDKDTTLRSKFLIDASGARRITRHFLKLDEVFLTPPMTCWTGRSFDQSGHDIRTTFSMQTSGWTWFAPEDKHHVTWSTLELQGNGKVRSPLPDLEPKGKSYAYNVRWRVFRPVCDQQVLLCGAAAGILDPAAGQGILNALMSGIKAGHCLIACMSEPELENWHFAMYDQWFITQYEQKVEDLAKYYKEAGINILLQSMENTVNT